MTSPRLSHQIPAKEYGFEHRMYGRVVGGEPEAPSITTILDAMNPRLDWWEARCAVDEAVSWAPRLAQVVASGDKKTLKAARSWMEGAAGRDRDAASARGDLVHDYLETWCLRQIGKATDADVEEHRQACITGGVEAYLTHVHAFLDAWQLRVLQPEATVWNTTVGYAGTTDLIAEVNVGGQWVQIVADWKTKKALYRADGSPKSSDLRDYTGMQLAAAAYAEEIWVPGELTDTGEPEWRPFPYRPQLGIAVGFAPDGYVVRQYDIHHPLMFKSFCALRTVWEFQRAGKRELMSPPMMAPANLRPLTPHPNPLP